jgi:hypothetical protein
MPNIPNEEASYSHILIGDVNAARTRLDQMDSPMARRDLVRATFSAVEGLLWRLKQRVLDHASQYGSLSIHDLAALMEESYNVRNDGSVNPQTRYLPTATSIRVTVRAAQHLFNEYKLDFGHVGWACLQRAIDVRNRIMHPKTPTDLFVSDDEVDDCIRGFGWFLALVIEVAQRIIDDLGSRTARITSSATKLSDA